MKRLITGILLAAFALWAIFYAPQPAFVATALLIACLCYHEFAGIVSASGIRSRLLWLGYAAGIAAVWKPETLFFTAPLALIASLGMTDLPKVLGMGSALVMGVVYAFLPWKWAIELREINVAWLFFALSVNWIGDSGAYYVGRKFGRHKLAPRVSPGKSWEGTMGAVVACAIYGLIYNQQAHLGIDWPIMLALSVATNAAGQAGDLVESAFKRGAGVKDSGTLLPGHGGVLDRLDSSLFTLPVVYFFLRWVQGA